MSLGRQQKGSLTSELSLCREGQAVKEALSCHLPQKHVCDFRFQRCSAGAPCPLKGRGGGEALGCQAGK